MDRRELSLWESNQSFAYAIYLSSVLCVCVCVCVSFNYLIIYYFPSAVRRETMTNLLYLYTRSKI